MLTACKRTNVGSHKAQLGIFTIFSKSLINFQFKFIFCLIVAVKNLWSSCLFVFLHQIIWSLQIKLFLNWFLLLQVFNEINSRQMEKINVFHGIFSSWIFSAVLVSTVIFQVIIVQFLGAFASTVPLSWRLWLLSILIGAISMVYAFFLKCIPVEPSKQPIRDQNGYEPIPGGPEEV